MNGRTGSGTQTLQLQVSAIWRSHRKKIQGPVSKVANDYSVTQLKHTISSPIVEQILWKRISLPCTSLPIHCAPACEGHSRNSPRLWGTFPQLKWCAKEARNPLSRLCVYPPPLFSCLRASAHMILSTCNTCPQLCLWRSCQCWQALMTPLIHSFIHSTNLPWTIIIAWHWSGCWEKTHQISIISSIFPSLNLTCFLSIDSVVFLLPLRAIW